MAKETVTLDENLIRPRHFIIVMFTVLALFSVPVMLFSHYKHIKSPTILENKKTTDKK